ncbi:MAG: DNA polymerase [Magnetococcus sp. YQC-9]
MTTLHLDLETRATADLKKVGVFTYAAHPQTDIWCAAFAVDDGPVQVWTPGMPCPEEIETAVLFGWTIMAHNAQFEQTLWAGVLSPRYGWPEPDHKQWQCTMAMALAMSLPAALGDAAAAVGLDHDKDMKGRRLMLQMCKPRSIQPDGTPVWWDDAARVERLIAYCQQDVVVERALAKRLLPLRKQEQELWWLDQEINRRGVCLDTVTVRAAQAVVDAVIERLDEQMRLTTDGAVSACSNAGQLTAWLRSRGMDVSTVAKTALPEYLEEADLPTDVRTAIELRQEAAKSSTAKLRAMELVAGEDHRARGLFQYHAASTGRWGGRLIQTQNMPRGDLNPHEVQDALRLIIAGDVDFLDMMYGYPMAVISSCLRGLIQAAPGHELMTVDFASIEARVVAWLAGEERVLEVFRGDGLIYELAASGIYNVPMEAVTKQQRLIGKISVLALGFGGGKVAFQSMAKNYGVQITGQKAEEIKVAWRAANPNIVRFWKKLEEAAMEALRHPRVKVSAGSHILFVKNGSFLWCRLPSGRSLCYPYPVIIKQATPWGEMKDTIAFKGIDPVSHKWCEQTTFGGRLAENVTQAVARDLLAEAMLRVSKAGLPIVLHVHDEVSCEIPESNGDLKAFERMVAEVPLWAKGLPIGVEGWIGKRYRK